MLKIPFIKNSRQFAILFKVAPQISLNFYFFNKKGLNNCCQATYCLMKVLIYIIKGT